MNRHILGRLADHKLRSSVAKIDFVIVLVSIFVLMGVIGYARPLIIAPMDDYESLDGEVLFEFERADVLLIDDNMDFSSPDRYDVSEGMEITLEPGQYYWKVSGVLRSEIRSLKIESVVELKVIDVDGGLGVVNAGNVGLNVDVYDGDELVEKKKLRVGESVFGGDKFVGEYDE